MTSPLQDNLLVAQGVPAPGLFLTLLMLVGVIVAGVVVIVLVRKKLLEGLEKRSEEDDLPRLLDEYKRLRDEGVIDDEEYRRIREKLLSIRAATGGTGPGVRDFPPAMTENEARDDGRQE